MAGQVLGIKQRLLCALIVGVALTVIPAGAHASIEISIDASAVTIDHGESATIRGQVPAAKVGSELRLQRRKSGRWIVVTSSELSARKTYSFDVRPPKGNQVYRVLLPRQLGQSPAVSSRLTIAVRWRPRMTLDPVVPVHDLAKTQFLAVDGHSNAIGATVRLERQSIHGWEEWDETVVDPDGSFSAQARNLPRGTVVRARIPGRGPRLVASSAVQVTELAPFALTLNGPELVMGGVAGSGRPPQAPGAVAHFTAQQGDLVTFVWSFSKPDVFTVLGPDGLEVAPSVPRPLDAGMSYFVMPSDGTYSLLAFTQYDTRVTLHAYRQSIAATTLDAPARSVDGAYRGQIATLEFGGVAGQVVGAAIQYEPYVGFCGRVELLHEGQVVPPTMPHMWVLEADGAYALAFIPCAGEFVGVPRVRVAVAARRTATLNDAPATAVLDDAGEGAIFSFEASAGDEVKLFTHRANGWAYPSSRIFGPDGSILPVYPGSEFTAPQSGTYEVWYEPTWFTTQPGEITLWVSTPLEITSTLNGEPVTLGPALRRRLDFHFSGLENQYLTLFEEYAEETACATALKLFDESGQLHTYLGPSDVIRLPHDGEYEARVYPCATSGDIGLASSMPATLNPGESGHLELVHPSGAVIAVVPEAAPGSVVEVTVSGIQIGAGDAYRAGLYTRNGGQVDILPATTANDPFTLRNLYADRGTVFYLRSENPRATGAVDLSVSVIEP